MHQTLSGQDLELSFGKRLMNNAAKQTQAMPKWVLVKSKLDLRLPSDDTFVLQTFWTRTFRSILDLSFDV